MAVPVCDAVVCRTQEVEEVPTYCTCNGAWKSSDMCSPCKWSHHYESSWYHVLRDMHLKEGKPFACPIVKLDCTTSFRIGCDTSSTAKHTCRFASFNVSSPAYLQLVNFRRHCESPRHIAACVKVGVHVGVSRKKANELSVDANTPGSQKFS